MSPIPGIVASQISGHLASPTSFDSIATVTVGSGGSSTISFTSIPSTYKHLQLRMTTRAGVTGTGSEWILASFNSDTATNYSWHYLGTDSTSVVSGNSLTATGSRIGLHWSTSNLANTFHGNIVDILDYTDTNKYKTTRSLVGSNTNTGTYSEMFLLSSNWRSTSAINSITLTSNWSFGQYSSIALYGIKG
jgi:hypothetical protein